MEPKPSGRGSVVKAYDLGSQTALAVVAVSTLDTERAKTTFLAEAQDERLHTG